MTTEQFISPEQRTTLADAVRRLGVTEVAKRLGISNESVLRIAGDYGSQAGTEALAVQRLGRLELVAWPCPIDGCKSEIPHLHAKVEA